VKWDFVLSWQRVMREQLLDEETRRVIGYTCAAAPANVSLLRRIDVAVWMPPISWSRGTG
jgi:hypothetical protein